MPDKLIAQRMEVVMMTRRKLFGLGAAMGIGTALAVATGKAAEAQVLTGPADGGGDGTVGEGELHFANHGFRHRFRGRGFRHPGRRRFGFRNGRLRGGLRRGFRGRFGRRRFGHHRH